jgi:UDP-2-acetamido-2-deoxy-ribo-hexuluronate aminotransferase
MIKYGNVARFFKDIKEEYISCIESAAESEIMFNGPYTKEVEQRLEKITGRKALLVTSGSIAMTLVLRHLGVGPGDEVITINYGPPAVVGPITFSGAKTIFVDIDSHGAIDCKLLPQALTQNTKAVVAVGLYGDVHDHDLVSTFCVEHGLHYINDANQSCFAKYKGIDSCRLGDYTTIGFAENKPLPTLSTYGAMLFDTEEQKHKLNRMRKHGKPYRLEPLTGTGLNAWPDEHRSIQLKLSMDRFDKWQSRRHQIAQYYYDNLSNTRKSPIYSEWNTHKFVVFFDDKLKAQKKLFDLGIETVPHYTESYGGNGFKNTMHYVKHALTLPLNPYISDSEVEHIVDMVKKLQ